MFAQMVLDVLSFTLRIRLLFVEYTVRLDERQEYRCVFHARVTDRYAAHDMHLKSSYDALL